MATKASQEGFGADNPSFAMETTVVVNGNGFSYGEGEYKMAEYRGRTESEMATDRGVNCCSRWPPWRVVMTCVACFVIQFTLGIHTANVGNMIPYVASYLRNRTDGNLDYTDTVWINQVDLIMLCGSMPFMGLLERHFNPSLFKLIGVTFFGSCFFATAFAVKQSFPLTVMSYGILNGLGHAILQPTCLSLPLKWLPQRKGLVGGLIGAGLGSGAFVWNQVITGWINPDNLDPDLTVGEDVYYSQEEVLDNVPTCYLLLGGIMLATQLTCVLCMWYPDEKDVDTTVQIDVTFNDVTTDQLDDGTKDSDSGDGLKVLGIAEHDSVNKDGEAGGREKDDDDAPVEFGKLEAIKSRPMLTILPIYFFTDTCINIFNSFYKTYGQTFVNDDHLLAIMGSVSAVCNSLGFPLCGLMADRWGFQKCLLASQILLMVATATFILCPYGGAAMIFIWTCLAFLAQAGTFGLLPPMMFSLYGGKNFTFNMGFEASVNVGSAIMTIYVIKAVKYAFGWEGTYLTGGAFALIGVMVNMSLWFDCGFPLSAHFKRVLFKNTAKRK